MTSLEKDRLTPMIPQAITVRLSPSNETPAWRWDRWKETSPKGHVMRVTVTVREAVPPRTHAEQTTKQCRSSRRNPHKRFRGRHPQHFIATRASPFRPRNFLEARRGRTMPLEKRQMNDLHVELKVCEGCGALWLRTGVANGVYCRTCVGRIAEFPRPRGRRTASKTCVTRTPVTVSAGGAR